MLFLKKYIRSLIYSAAVFLAFGIFVFQSYVVPTEAEMLTNLIRQYALISLALLFATLTPGLIRGYFPGFILNSLLTISRRALGVSAFFFGFLHASIVFFYGFGGSVSALFALTGRPFAAIFLGLAALFVLTLMAITSLDRVAAWLGYAYWKMLHRCVYAVIIFILFHAFFIGTHFIDRQSFASIALRVGAFLYIILEVMATARRLRQSASARSPFRTTLYMVLLALFVLVSIGVLAYAYIPLSV